MLINLDNVSSTKQHPNENLGRELLELHTVGRGDVRRGRRQGLRPDPHRLDASTCGTPSGAEYRPGAARPRPGPGASASRTANADADGRAVTREYLRYLAHHPATARRVARRLAVKFVRDDPPPALVNHLAQVYLDNDTAIVPVLRALVDSQAFGRVASAPRCATPARTWSRRTAPSASSSAGRRRARPATGTPPTQLLWQVDGDRHDAVRLAAPRRAADRQRVLVVPGAAAGLDGRAPAAWRGGWWPDEGAHLPPARVRGCRSSRSASTCSSTTCPSCSCTGARPPQLLEACCQAVDVEPRERITRDHGVVRWNMPRLLTTFLDSPAHLTR